MPSPLRQSASAKLRFLAETVLAESALLRTTDGRLFALPMDAQRAGTLRDDIDLAASALMRGHLAVPLLATSAQTLAERVLFADAAQG